MPLGVISKKTKRKVSNEAFTEGTYFMLWPARR